jgi:hypothetical protein
MTPARLQALYNAGVRREKRIPDPETSPDETEDQRNRRILLAALKQQQSMDQRNKGRQTRYTDSVKAE